MNVLHRLGLFLAISMAFPWWAAQAVSGTRDALDPLAGEGVFRKVWTTDPVSRRASDGLGPLFNATACAGCHGADRAVYTPQARLGINLGDGGVAGDPVYGHLLQSGGAAGVPPEGHLAVAWSESSVALADGVVVRLRQPKWWIADPGYGALDPRTIISPRMASDLSGLGRLAAVPADVIAEFADPTDADGDGVSGRVAWIEGSAGRERQLGRFGWKAQQPSLRRQVAAAFAIDLGLSTPLRPDPAGDCTSAQQACRDVATAMSNDTIEVSDPMLDLLAAYLVALPPQEPSGDETAIRRQGQAVFLAAGCGRCHRPDLLSAAMAQPYTDLLLHDLGNGLADGLPQGAAGGREWRTAPLWGLAMRLPHGEGFGLLHDGRARSTLEAILWHGGEGAAARDHIIGLSPIDRAALIAFLESL